MRPTTGLLLVPLWLTACATPNFGPEATIVTPAATVPVPSNWVEPAPDALPNADWVASFSDAQLNALVAEAVSENKNIGAASARLDAALARETIAGADRKPTLSLSSRVSRTENVDDFFDDRTTLSTGLNASWEPDLWGRIRDTITASELETEATAADVAGATLSIAGQVSQAWFDLIEARLLTELSLRDVETQERALLLTQRRFEGGVTGSSDVRLARSSVASAKALQALREQSKSAITRRLEVLLARYPSEEIQAARDLPDLPPLTGASVPAEVLARRPDLLALEARLAGQGIQIDQARKALLPRLTLNGDTTLNGTGISSFFDLDALAATLVANLTAPIFQGGRIKANIEQQKALLRAQLETYAGAVLTAYLEVENALDAESRLSEREAALRVSLDESLKAEERLELRYTEGLATILQLLDAQSRRLSAEGQLIGARKERLANRVRLHVALGGGEYGELPATPVDTASNITYSPLTQIFKSDQDS
ncbi:efflux transporter outer membrane subunit [Litorimonas sp. RW-G-Af-16]|uniref:efflux transporter outer membrane subunit n=1 Tax=Litorimonas sp. RW-G-Af-16 TaxID=3241168 RepID=UPI00390C771A